MTQFESINGYRITEKMYDGTRSLVYRGYRKKDSLAVVLKILKEGNASPERIAWFQHEYEVTYNMHLDVVPKVYGFEQLQHHWTLIQEDFGGESLRRLQLCGKLSLKEFVMLAIDIADILAQVHQQHIMHKDVNPANIVLNPTTRSLKLIDFGIATVLSRENPTFRNPSMLEGTLPYMSPEQAGRMNRAMDYRTDFYSLGITLYELLTGQVPFTSDDPLELVHSHIARQPTPPHKLRTDIPLAISEIILKLIAKNAEDRYQSAYGLKADLEYCLRQLEQEGTIEPFAPGTRDVSDKFHIPQKLYGRETEINKLLTAFDRVSQSAREMMLVAGTAGIGKSALVQEIYKPLTRQRGFFTVGKFDQFQRNVPYSAFIQAFRTLTNYLLTESDEAIAAWKQRFYSTIGKNGKIITDVIPEVALIVGEQPDVATLGPAESQNRLSLAFQKFVGLFTSSYHPLVLFLDDLQWADSASLKLLELLMTAHDYQYLFMIGAYRENETASGHPLWITIEEIRNAGTPLHTLTLQPLDLAAVSQLIQETVHCTALQAQQLAELITAKTGGNPFFIVEFLKSLYIEELLSFDPANGVWTWDLPTIQQQDITDNVVTLMATRVQRLDDDTQAVLKLAACIGNQFTLSTLATVNEKSARYTAHELWQAVTDGLVLPLNEAYQLAELDVEGLSASLITEYKFTHDRIQQAVYSLIPDEEKGVIHWRIGQLLLQDAKQVPSHFTATPSHHMHHNVPDTLSYSASIAFPPKVEEHIFDIVNHLNRGRSYNIHNREELIVLNLMAGEKANASAAHEQAMSYLRVGRELLGTTGWQEQYNLTFRLYHEYAKCAYLNNNQTEAEQLFRYILKHVQSVLEKTSVYTTKMVLYTSMGKLNDVLRAGVEALHLLGIVLPRNPSQATIDEENRLLQEEIGARSISDLIELPHATDPVHRATMDILMNILISTWWLSNTSLLYLLTIKMVRLSLQHGNTPESPVGYVWYGVLLGPGQGDYLHSYEAGTLALQLNKQYHAVHRVAMINLVFGVFIHFWRFHMDLSLKYLKRGYQTGIDSGDLLWAGINSYAIIYTMLIKGDTLDTVFKECQRYLDFAKETRQIIPLNMLTLSQQFILSLKGKTNEPASFSTAEYHETTHVQEIESSEAIRPSFWYYKLKLQTLYLFQRYDEALDIAFKLDRMVHDGATFGNITITEHFFYHALTIAAVYNHTPYPLQQHYWEKLLAYQQEYKRWSDNCPENFRHKYLLLSAEIARIKKQYDSAKMLFEKAIVSAQDNGFTQNYALAHELLAHLYLSQGLQSLATNHLIQARDAYLTWGATAKAYALDTCYPEIFAITPLAETQETPTTTGSGSITTSSGLDLSTVIKASQAISDEIVLDTLLTKLMRIVIENAGAQRGLLILQKGLQWVISAEGTVGNDEVHVLQSVVVEEHAPLPISIINYVARTRKNVVLRDAIYADPFARDAYIMAHKPRSVLCAPLLNQGTLMGMLYLENNLTTDAFTPERLEVLNLLAGQAAVSIKNAVLYNDLEQSEVKYRNLFENSHDAIFITTAVGNIIDMNPAGVDLFGYTREEIMTIKTVNLYANPNDRAKFQLTIAHNGSVRDYEVQFRCKDGTPVDCLMTANVRYAPDGKTIQGYQGIIRDITAQKQAETERAALLDQQARRAGELHAIIQSMADGLLVVDKDELIIIINPVAARLLHQDPHTLIGKPISCLSDTDDPVLAIGLQHIVEQIRLELNDPTRSMPEERLSLGECIVRLESAPTLGSGNVLTGAVMVLQDITEAMEADHAKSAFIATASHEMRTPLASMKGFVDVFYLSGIDNLTDSQHLFLDAIKRQTDNLVLMVNDLLEVARLEQGIRVERRWVSLPHMVEESISTLKPQIEKKQITLNVTIEPYLPHIWIDSMHLRRILLNIFSNAVKYVRQYGHVAIHAYRIDNPTQLPQTPITNQPWLNKEERSVVIQVEDNGVGIRESDQTKIFTRFYRSENPLSVESGGSGLGLAITHSLIHLHHGQIGFQSKEGKGSCFWVRLPAPTTESLLEEKGTSYE